MLIASVNGRRPLDSAVRSFSFIPNGLTSVFARLANTLSPPPMGNPASSPTLGAHNLVRNITGIVPGNKIREIRPQRYFRLTDQPEIIQFPASLHGKSCASPLL